MKIKIEYYLLLIVILFLMFIFLCFDEFRVGKNTVRAVDGVVDLSGFDFDEIRNINIGGEFKIVYNSLLSPDNFKPGREIFKPETIDISDPKPQTNICGTYRLQVHVKQTSDTYGIRIPPIYSAYRLWVDNSLVVSGGNPGMGREYTQALSIPRLITIKPRSIYFNITIEVANFHDRFFGLYDGLQLGLEEEMKKQQTIDQVIDGILFGALIILALFNIALYILGKQNNIALLFGLVCFLTALRIILTRQHLFLVLFPSYNYEIYKKVEFLSLYLTLPLFYLILNLQFKKVLCGKILRGGVGLVALLSLFVIVTPLQIFSYSLIFFLGLLAFSIVYFIVMIFMEAHNGTGGAMIIVTGLVYFFIALCIEVYKSRMHMITGHYMTIGLILFIIAVSYFFASRFAYAFIQSERLSKQLQEYSNELEHQVKIRTKQLIEVNHQKTQFFINLAHETRTPLTLIDNYLDKDIKKRGESDEILVVKNNIIKLKDDMINFLDHEKLEKGQIFYNHEQIVNFSALLESKVILFEELASKKNITLKASLEDDLYLAIDPFALDRIVNNLLDNACKYSDNNGRIEVVLSRDDEIIVFRVRNTGTGISPEQIESIFKAYYQISHEKQNIQGIGMGLTIVKKIVDQVNGEIKVESDADNGTCFTLKFNRVKVRSDDSEVTLEYSHPIAVNTDVALQDEVFKKGNKTVFIIEDNLEMLAYLQNCLSVKYNVFYAFNGQNALDKLSSIPIPDLIISDIMMDTMDGYALFNEVTKLADYQNIPFIFLTARAGDKLKGLEMGALDYITKPFLIEELVAKIDSIIKHADLQKATQAKRIKEKIRRVLLDEETNYSDVHNEEMEINLSGYGFTQKDIDVIILLLKGLEYKEISSQLDIKLGTVKKRIHMIYKKCGVQNKVELINLLRK